MLLQLPHAIVDLERRIVDFEDGAPARLTPIEARLLDYLASKAGVAATREELLERVWGYAPTVVSRAVDATVRRIRMKIEVDPADPQFILTDWGAGYRLAGLLDPQGDHVPSEPVLVCALIPAGPTIAKRDLDVWREALATYLSVAETELGLHGGYRIRSDGDELLSAFVSARQAVGFCEGLQVALLHAEWSEALMLMPEAKLESVNQTPVYRGLRVAMAVTREGVRREPESTQGAPTYSGPGVRAVRAAAATVEAGWVRVAPALLMDAGAAERWVSSPDAVPVELAGRNQRDLTAPKLFGRALELAQMAAALEIGRLVTLHGTGGVGKTALSEHLPEELGIPALFCMLETCQSAWDVLSAVGTTLGVPILASHAEDAATFLGRVLAARPGLFLVLDNAEQVSSELAGLLPGWLERAPTLRVLVTSRRPLGLEEEETLALGPLPMTAAMALFAARVTTARGSAPGLSEEEACRRVIEGTQGIPLAIELAAARTRVFAILDLAERLEHSSRLLSDMERSEQRHGSVGSAIRWSWDQLDPWSQATMAQLAVFVGPFTSRAAEAIVRLPPEAPWVLDILDGLVRDALVEVQSGIDHRFRLLVPIRQFAAAHLGASDVHDRHVHWFAARGETGFLDGLDGPDERFRQHELRSELADLRAAFRTALAEDVTSAAQCWLAESRYVRRFEPSTKLLETLDQLDLSQLSPALGERCRLARAEISGFRSPALALPELVALRSSLSTDACGGRVGVAELVARLQSGAYDGFDTLYQETIALCVRTGDEPSRAQAMKCLGVFQTHTGHPESAIETLREALEIARECGAMRLHSKVLTNLGSAFHAAGQIDAAWQTYSATLQPHRAAGDPGSLARLQVHRGNLAVSQGRMDAAVDCFDDALGVFRSLADERHESITILNLSQVHVVQGEPEAAIALLERALVLVRRADNRPSEAYARMNLARAEMLREDPGAALAQARLALEVVAEASHALATSAAHLVLARAQWFSGSGDDALQEADRGLEVLSTRDLPQVSGRLWLVKALVERTPDAIERAGRLLDRAKDIEARGVLFTLETGRLEEAKAAADTLGCGPRSWLRRAIASVEEPVP